MPLYLNENMSGSTILKGKEFSWSFNRGIGKIITEDRELLLKSLGYEGDKTFEIKLIDGRVSYLNRVNFINCTIKVLEEVYFYPQLIIKLRQQEEDNSFDLIKFEGEFLNKFYDPIENSINKVDIRDSLIYDKFRNGETCISTKPFSESDIYFSNTIFKQELKFSFNTSRLLDGLTSSHILDRLNTTFNIELRDRIDFSETYNLIEYVIKFFHLLLFTNRFTFEKITLYRKSNEGFYPIGELIVDINHLSTSPDFVSYQSIELFKDKLSNFMDMAVINASDKTISVDDFIKDNVNPINTVVNYRTITDLAMSFENYYRRFYESRDDNNIFLTDFEKNFNNTLITNLRGQKDRIDPATKKSLYNRDERSVISKYISSIKHIGMSLLNKGKNVSEDFSGLLDTINIFYLNTITKQELGKMPWYFATFRNKMLHGNFVEVTHTVESSFIYMKLLTYAILLRELKFNDDEIDEVIKKLRYVK